MRALRQTSTPPRVDSIAVTFRIHQRAHAVSLVPASFPTYCPAQACRRLTERFEKSAWAACRRSASDAPQGRENGKNLRR